MVITSIAIFMLEYKRVAFDIDEHELIIAGSPSYSKRSVREIDVASYTELETALTTLQSNIKGQNATLFDTPFMMSLSKTRAVRLRGDGIFEAMVIMVEIEDVWHGFFEPEAERAKQHMMAQAG